MSEKTDLTWRQQQKATKPPIEDVIPVCLDGEMKKIALDFVSYMSENKMILRFGGVTDTWRCNYKGNPICNVRLRAKFYEGHDWLVSLSVLHMDKYADKIISEGLHDIVWNNLSYHHRCGGTCGNERKMIIFGKEIEVCWKILGIIIGNPDEMSIKSIKRLMELEKKAREDTR